MTVRVQDPTVYVERRLVDKGHFASYWYQIHELEAIRPAELLEIGVGNRFLSSYFRARGLNVTTLDIESQLSPDVVGTMTSLPFRNEAFEAVACFEVLEHLPFEHFPVCLSELARVARRAVVISVPDASRAYRLLLRLPGIKTQAIIEFFPQLKPSSTPSDGPHYWEIGHKGYPLQRIQTEMKRAGLEVAKTYRIFEYVRHRFFISSKGNRLPMEAQR